MRWKSLSLLVLLLIGFGSCKSSKGKGDPAAPPAVTVSVKQATKSDIPIYLNGLGSVIPINSVTVRTRIDGQLIRITVDEGELVKQGTLVAEIDERTYQVQLEQAEGQLARDQALLQNARIDLERYQTLVSQDAIPSQQLDTQKSTVAQYEGVVKIDQGAIDNAKLQITYCRITAPISGRVGLRLVDPGNMVHASDQNGLIVITQIAPINVVFSLPEKQLAAVREKQDGKTKLRVDALDRDGAKVLATGYLLTTDNQIDPTTGTVKVKSVFENHDDSLFPNQFVNARLELEIMKSQILIPSAAVQHGPQGNFVYIVDSSQKAHTRPVTTGPAQGNVISIKSGIKEGESVVVDGADRIKDGSAVSTK